MNANFPLVLLPKRVVFVDDDQDFLEVVRFAIPRDFSRTFISDPHRALLALTQEAPYWAELETLMMTAHQARIEGLGEPHVYANAYFNDWRRFHVTTVLVVDYAMPGMTGVQMVKSLDPTPCRRVLLTGEADASTAISAFNEGAIHKFIPKATPDITAQLRSSVEEMHATVCEHFGQLIRPTLTSDQLALLQAPAVVQGLWKKVTDLQWVEHVVVGQPFGLLGKSATGPLQWLQLETPESLGDLSEAVGQYGYTREERKRIELGEVVTAAELFAHLQAPYPKQLLLAEPLSTTPVLLGAVIDLPVPAKTCQIQDIRTSGELLKAMLRNVLHAHRRDEQIAQRLTGPLAAYVALSPEHQRELAALLEAERVPSALVQQIMEPVNRAIGGQRG